MQSVMNPSQFPTPMTESWERFSKNFENLFYSLEEETPVKETDTGSTMNLGTGQLLGLNEVLAIETSQAFPFHNPFYWRQRSYDLYTNGQWSTGPARTITYHASEDLQKPSFKYLIPVDVKVTSKLAQLGTIYTPGLPVMINKPVRVTYTLEGDSQADPTVLFVSPAVRYGETYRLNAVISAVTREDLLIAGSDYPQWIRERYLQLPADLSPWVRALSLQLTASQQTPFEKAAAITEYLRTHITYQTTIAAPAVGRDVIEWFLFDYQKGFCNYYATAEVLMLRAAGVPARLSVGYAQGVQTDLNQTQFSVREKDRHAWPEVYFPGYGWIPFEPTTAISPVDYSGSGAGTAQGGMPGSGGILSGATSRTGLTGEDRAEAILESQFSGESGLQVEPKLTLFGKGLIGFAVVAGLTALFFLARWLRRKWNDITSSFIDNQRRLIAFFAEIPLLGDAYLSIHLSRAERSFLTIERSLRLLGIRLPPGSTASEQVAALIDEIPELEGDARALRAFYQTSVYGKKESAPERTGLAAMHINLAVARVLLKRMIAPFNRQKSH
jgi:transglutaminase-like putative cysteine protease